MDHPFSSSSSLAMIIAFLTFVIIISTQRYKKKKMGPNKSNLPPGPRRLPIVGNLHQLTGALPHRRLTELGKKHGPVMFLKLGELPCVVVSSKEAAEEVVRTKDTLSAQRPVTIAAEVLSYNCRDISFAPYGEYWREMRKICVVHLTSAKQVASLRSVREAEVTTLLASIAGLSSRGHPVNLSKTISSVTTSVISRATFGYSCKPVDAFNLLIPRIFEITAGFSIAEFFPSVGVLQRISGMRGEVVKLHQEIDEVLESVIDEYRASKEAGRAKENDILGVLLDLQDQGDSDFSLSTESIKAILFDVFAAGIESSSTIIEWTMSEIVKHPEVLKSVQAEVRLIFHQESSIDETSLNQLKFMNAVIKESLRLHPPAPLLFPREARESFTIDGYEIHPKTRIFVNVWAIGRDPTLWTDAEKFCPERFLHTDVDYKGSHLEFIPFGSGRRMCPGMIFGMTTIELILANLLYHFNWELPDNLTPDDVDMTEVLGTTVRRKHDLCLIATPHRP